MVVWFPIWCIGNVWTEKSQMEHFGINVWQGWIGWAWHGHKYCWCGWDCGLFNIALQIVGELDPTPTILPFPPQYVFPTVYVFPPFATYGEILPSRVVDVRVARQSSSSEASQFWGLSYWVSLGVGGVGGSFHAVSRLNLFRRQ